MHGSIAFARSVETDRVLGDGSLAGVVQGVAGEGHVAAIRAGHADGAVEKLAAGDIDSLTLIQLE